LLFDKTQRDNPGEIPILRILNMEKFDSLKGKAYFFLLFFWFLWFLNFVGRTIFSPLLPLLEDEYHITHAAATSIFIFQSLGYAISIFFSGFLTGIFGLKRSIMFSLIASSIIFFCILFFKMFSALYLFSFIIGASAGIYLPSAIPLITHYFEKKNWDKAIAFHDSAASIGVFAAPILAVFLLQFLNWREVFSAIGVLFLITSLFLYLFVDELKVGMVDRAGFSNFIKSKTLWILGLLWAFAVSSSMGIYFVIPLYLTKELHLEIGYANSVFGISRIGGFAAAIGAGFLAGRFSLQKLMAYILIISGIFTIFVALAGVELIGLALFLQASLIYGFFPLGFIAVSRLYEVKVRGIATGFVIGFGMIIGWGMTPYLLGISGDYLSFKFGIMVLGISVILSSGLVLLLKDLHPIDISGSNLNTIQNS
jgi:NNP family nitrate/nitrite transporter-like MFS transporter